MSVLIRTLRVKPGGMRWHSLLVHNDPSVISDFGVEDYVLEYGLHCSLEIVNPKTGKIEAKTSLHPFLQITDKSDHILESKEEGLFYEGKEVKINPDSDITIHVMRDEICKWITDNKYQPSKKLKVKYQCDSDVKELQLFAHYNWEDSANPIEIIIPKEI